MAHLDRGAPQPRTPGLIGEGAVIGADAVVTSDVPPWETCSGAPARKLGERPRAA